MDYNEEQSNELEVLASIYPDEFSIVDDSSPITFTVSVSGESDEGQYDGSQIHVSCTLQFTYVERYPEEKPNIDVPEYDGIEETDVEDLKKFLYDQAEENLGMAMVFTLVSGAQEKLVDLANTRHNQKEAVAQERLRAQEEEERKKFEGTRVTVESFLAWKAKFDAEMSSKGKTVTDTGQPRKKTGKQLFEQDKTLEESELQFLEEGDEEVQIDESLFQDLDDLDLDDLDADS